MKKRMFCLMLCIVLCLSACKNQAQPTETAPTTEADEFFIDGALPDIGKYSSSEKYTRYYDKYTPTFQPQYDYGTLVPFIGKNYDFSIKNDDPSGSDLNSDFNTSLYGLCTTDGKIVTDAGYYTAINEMSSPDGFDFYCLMYQTDAGNDVSDYYSTIIPSDGSWEISAPKNAWVSGASEGIIELLIPRDGGNGYDIRFYDYKGKQLFEVSDMDYCEKYSGSLALLKKYSYVDGEYDASGSNNYCYYIDKNGKTQLSRFVDAGSFNEYGIAFASPDGINYGLMDKTGKFVTEQKYTGIFNCGSLGWFQAINGDSRDIYSPDGILVKTIDTENYVDLTGTDESNMVYSYFDTVAQTTRYFRLSDGKSLACTETGEAPNSYIYLESNSTLFLHRDSEDYAEDSKSYIFDYTGRKICDLVGMSTICDISDDGKTLLYVRGQSTYVDDKYQNNSELVVYDIENRTETASFAGYSYASFFGKDDKFLRLYNYGEPEGFGSNESYAIYSFADNKMLFEPCNDFVSFNAAGKAFYAVSQNSKMTLYNEDFKVVLRLINDYKD